jgi:adenosylcobinamide-GDP ribazoletransferase
VNVLRDIGSAVRLLTVLPLPGDEGRRPVSWFPLVGWLFVGAGMALVWIARTAARAEGLSALLVSALVVALWAALSGALHWDGLADVADGMGVRGDAEKRLAVMRDSTVGAFGVVAVVLVALVQVAALGAAIEAGSCWALGAPVIGRFGAAAALWLRRPARHDGLGARYAGTASFGGTLLLVAPLVPLVALAPSLPRAAGLLVSCAAALLVPGLFTRRLSGMTGDVLGATVVLTETVVLVIAAFAGGWL